MKRILIIASDKEELEGTIQTFEILKSRINPDISVEFEVTGMGTTSTGYLLTKKITEAKCKNEGYDLIIDLGIAGSYKTGENEFPVGSAALIEREFFGDMGFETFGGFKTLFECDSLDKNIFPYKNGSVERTASDTKTEKFLAGLKKANGITVQKVTGNDETLSAIKKHFDGDIESMEGAAVYYVCAMENIPCFEIRTVSNEVGEKDRVKWNITLALESLKSVMVKFIEILLS
ncbi:MAG: futalosine hydrolase [Bacteroidales bacterium]|jgi:futalosine hydrolase|nr:futalosine hydrolase [Bacteroidales bacterium]